MKSQHLIHTFFITTATMLAACSQNTFVASKNEAYRIEADAMIASGRLKSQEAILSHHPSPDTLWPHEP